MIFKIKFEIEIFCFQRYENDDNFMKVCCSKQMYVSLNMNNKWLYFCEYVIVIQSRVFGIMEYVVKF